MGGGRAQVAGRAHRRHDARVVAAGRIAEEVDGHAEEGAEFLARHRELVREALGVERAEVDVRDGMGVDLPSFRDHRTHLARVHPRPRAGARDEVQHAGPLQGLQQRGDDREVAGVPIVERHDHRAGRQCPGAVPGIVDLAQCDRPVPVADEIAELSDEILLCDVELGVTGPCRWCADDVVHEDRHRDPAGPRDGRAGRRHREGRERSRRRRDGSGWGTGRTARLLSEAIRVLRSGAGGAGAGGGGTRGGGCGPWCRFGNGASRHPRRGSRRHEAARDRADEHQTGKGRCSGRPAPTRRACPFLESISARAS